MTATSGLVDESRPSLRAATEPSGSSSTCQLISEADALGSGHPTRSLMAHALGWLMRLTPASLGIFYTVDQRLRKYHSGCAVVRTRTALLPDLTTSLRRYHDRYQALDPFAPRRYVGRAPAVVDISELGDARALALSPYATEFLASLGMCAQTTIHLRSSGQVVAGIDLMRTRGDLPISGQQLAFLHTSQPFLEQAYACAIGLPPVDNTGIVVDRVQLTRRETEVAELVAAGASNAEIARALGIGAATVKSHLVRVFEKLNIRSRTQLAVRFNAARVTDSDPSTSLAQTGY